MTIKVIISHDQPTDTRAIVVQYTDVKGCPTKAPPQDIQPGESAIFWVHSGQSLAVAEV